jgi:phage baseplate assembly protein W
VRTLAIEGGDLVLTGGAYRSYEGVAKVAQDLRMALGEPLGNDRFHPGWGSRLFDFIGVPLDEATRFAVEQECNRVIGLYVAVQRDKIQRDTLAAARSRYRTSEVVAQVQGVEVQMVEDRVQVRVMIRTVDSQLVTLESEAAA